MNKKGSLLSRFGSLIEIETVDYRLIDWLIGWLVDWLIDRLIDWLVDRLIGCLIDWLIVPFQFVEYLENDSLVVEVWGRYKPVDESAANLNTKELMAREKTIISGGQTARVSYLGQM